MCRDLDLHQGPSGSSPAALSTVGSFSSLENEGVPSYLSYPGKMELVGIEPTSRSCGLRVFPLDDSPVVFAVND